LLIISETDEVNSGILAQRLNFQGEIDYINKSINTNEQFIDVSGVGSDIDASMITYLTIEAVGAAVSDFDTYPLNINFMPPERIQGNIIQVGNYEVDMYKFVALVVGGAVILGGILSAIGSSFFAYKINAQEGENSSSEKDIEIFRNTIAENEKNQKSDIVPTLTKIIETNKFVTDVYTALSTDIPDNIYIKRFVTNDNGGIGIIGEAKTSESVQDFVKGLREKNNDLMLAKLSINSKDDVVPAKIPNGFTFEIKTSQTDVSLNDDPLQTALQSVGNVTQNVTVAPMPQPVQTTTSGDSSSLMPPPSPLI
jgi:serine/threonine protein kinase